MNIKRAVITAAGRNQHSLPLQALVDRDGIQKSALRIIIEEALSSGVEDICLVICPGDQSAYRTAAGEFTGKLHFVEQKEPLGYGHAMLCAREFVGREPFLHFVSDHLYISREKRRCAEQLLEIASAEACSVSAVQATRESMLPYYGAIGGKRAAHRERLYEVDTVREKPTPTEAEQTLVVPGLRAAHYLCFFGMHVLTHGVIDILGEQNSPNPSNQGLRNPASKGAISLHSRTSRCTIELAAQNMHSVRTDGKTNPIPANSSTVNQLPNLLFKSVAFWRTRKPLR